MSKELFSFAVAGNSGPKDPKSLDSVDYLLPPVLEPPGLRKLLVSTSNFSSFHPRLQAALKELRMSLLRTAEAHLQVSKILSERPGLSAAESRRLTRVLRRKGAGDDAASDDALAEFQRISLSSRPSSPRAADPPAPNGEDGGSGAGDSGHGAAAHESFLQDLGPTESPRDTERETMSAALEGLAGLAFQLHVESFEGMLRLSDSLASGPLLAALDNLVSREGFEAAMAANEYEQARRGLARALKTSLEKKGAGKAARRAIDELHGEQRKFAETGERLLHLLTALDQDRLRSMTDGLAQHIDSHAAVLDALSRSFPPDVGSLRLEMDTGGTPGHPKVGESENGLSGFTIQEGVEGGD